MVQNPSSTLKWWIAFILALSQLSVGWSVTAVNLAIPTMMASLGASLNQIQWVLTGFLITRTVMMPTVGSLGSRMSDRSLFVLCTGVFTAGSFLCSIAWDAESLSVFRIIQAIGAGPLTAISMAIMFEAFPPHQRGLAMGIFSASWSIAPYIGPPLGGYIVEQLHWRAIFSANVFAGLINIVGAYFLFPHKKPEKKGQSFDLLGFLTFTGGTVALLVIVSQGQELGWKSPLVVISFAISMFLLFLFVTIQLTVKDPFMELRYFRSLHFSVVNCLNFLRVFCFRGASFLISLLLQKGLHYTPFQAGKFLLPGVFLTIVVAPLAGGLSDRLGPRLPILTGFGIMILAAYNLSTITPWASMISIFLFISMQSVGQACVNAPLNTIGFRASPEGKTRMASGILAMSRSLGESFGVASLSFLLERQTFLNLGSMTPLQKAYLSEAVRYGVFSQLRHLMLHAGKYGAALQTHARSFLSYTLLNEALTRSYQDLFFLIAALYVSMFVASALFLPTARKKVDPVRTT
jgi:DHA2 family multidrug resistance protein